MARALEIIEMNIWRICDRIQRYLLIFNRAVVTSLCSTCKGMGCLPLRNHIMFKDSVPSDFPSNVRQHNTRYNVTGKDQQYRSSPPLDGMI